MKELTSIPSQNYRKTVGFMMISWGIRSLHVRLEVKFGNDPLVLAYQILDQYSK